MSSVLQMVLGAPCSTRQNNTAASHLKPGSFLLNGAHDKNAKIERGARRLTENCFQTAHRIYGLHWLLLNSSYVHDLCVPRVPDIVSCEIRDVGS